MDPSPLRAVTLPVTRSSRMLPSPEATSNVPSRSSAAIAPSLVRACSVNRRGAVTVRLTVLELPQPNDRLFRPAGAGASMRM
jgi:hypothetical protein